MYIMSRNLIDQRLFTRIIQAPENRNTVMSVTIYPGGRFNMNSRLSAKLHGKPLSISFTEDALHFLLCESTSTDGSIIFPKNGSKLLPSTAEITKQGKLDLPAKFEAWLRDDGAWQGDCIENPFPSQYEKLPSSKKKK